MKDRKNPAFIVNWDSGEGTLDIGSRLRGEHPLFKVDVLGDLAGQAQREYRAAFDEMYPGQAERVRRMQNLFRRLAAEAMVGKVIVAVEALRNGDVAMELSDGRTVVASSDEGPVQLLEFSSLGELRREMADHYFDDRWVEEPTEEDKAEEQRTQANMVHAQVMGLWRPR